MDSASDSLKKTKGKEADAGDQEDNRRQDGCKSPALPHGIAADKEHHEDGDQRPCSREKYPMNRL